MVSSDWVVYFTENAANQMPIDWSCAYRLTPEEIRAVLRSVQQFQLGESSEGRHFIQQAEHYAERGGDIDLPHAIRLFIAEEQCHAAYLERFLNQQNLPLAHKHWVDSIFRLLRRAPGLEVSVVVLLTAEIIAMTYYKALHDATQSPTLRQICRQILHDEIKHLAFQRETLDKLRCKRSGAVNALAHGLQRVLFSGTLLVVWTQHRPVYRAEGSNFALFWQKNWSRYALTFA